MCDACSWEWHFLSISCWRCWAVNENMIYWWIIRFPILFASLVSMQWFTCPFFPQVCVWTYVCTWLIYCMFGLSDWQVNFVIFIKILKVIISKLRANNQSGYPDYKLRQVVAEYFYYFCKDLKPEQFQTIKKRLVHVKNWFVQLLNTDNKTCT